ncbi:hypothetical protein J7T55_007254 [Diaporthe amygdali]|uniref:uncharacterized protein n=1 Tax=Phomopsis amygdali TaxID=1214568 RepID=UPI0022FECF2A|nr:uncharacterized protein J7T55_007254 [Diaporthe amygdali]KAJ0108135.1 hypothetical protein J7T55_007254 [Diaporthe amygdali]
MENTRPEAQQKPFSEVDITPTPEITLPRQQSDISSDVYPAPLQTSLSSDRLSRSQTGSPPLSNPETETRPLQPSAVSSTRHERMPSVNSLPPKEGQFGVVSSSGQLVCEFRPTPNTDEAPQPPSKEQFAETSSSFSEQKSPEESVSPPPQGGSRPHAASLSSAPEGPTISTLELAVDYSNYPEVYLPNEEERPNLPPRSPIPRKSLPMDDSTPAPAYSTPADYQRIGYTGTLDMSSAVATVTPLHMLGDQSDMIDCPFCMKRVETSVKKKASSMTHTWGTVLFFTTLFGVVAPYCCDWYVNVEHYCKNCKRKVAQKKFNSDEMEALGTRPEHRQVSYFEPAEKPTKKFRS